jgi:hypothetical protein
MTFAGRQATEIGQGTFFDLAVFPERLTQKDGGRRVTVGYCFDVHGKRIA